MPVHDLVIHPRDREIVAGTHGRSVWIADALPVQELTEKVRNEAVHVFPVDPLQAERGWRGRASRWFDDSTVMDWFLRINVLRRGAAGPIRCAAR